MLKISLQHVKLAHLGIWLQQIQLLAIKKLKTYTIQLKIEQAIIDKLEIQLRSATLIH
jgi:hypothetical protein